MTKCVYVYVNGTPGTKAPDGRSAVVAETRSFEDRVLIDYDHEGRIFGVEIVGAGQVTESSGRGERPFGERLRWAAETVKGIVDELRAQKAHKGPET